MKRVALCFLVFGLINVSRSADSSADSETSESQDYSQAAKRGAAKLTDVDGPSFNHLSSSNPSGGSNSYGGNGFKATSTITTNVPPFKYIYNNQYYQPNSYLTYFPASSQIASQYSFHPNTVAHYLQTPTHFQYVATQNAYPTSNVVSEGASSTTSASTTSTSAVAPGNLVSPSKFQVPVYASQQSVQPIYYSQQPLYTFFVQPQPNLANIYYQRPNPNYLVKPQQFLSIYGGNRAIAYPHQGQLTYLVPTAVNTVTQQSNSGTGTGTGSGSDSKTQDKTSVSQTPASGNTYNYATKG